MPTVRLIDPDNVIREVPEEAVASTLQDPRWRVATEIDVAGRVGELAREADYGGVGGTVKAGLAGLARGATLGGFDAAARLLGGDQAAADLAALRDVNPGVSAGGEVLGALAPALVTGGGSAAASGAGVGARIAGALPSAAAARLGAGVARAGAEAGLAGRVGYAALGGTAEGALYGAGTGISEVSLSDRPLDIEHVAAAIGSNALYGGGLGGALGGAGKLAETGLARAKGALDSALERRAVKARTADEGIDTGDLELLDTTKLKAAREQELDVIRAERAPARTKIVEDLKAYRDAAYGDDLFKQHFGIKDGFIREAGGSLKSADRQIRKLLDKEVVLAERPERALELLQQQEQATTRLHGYGRDRIEEIAEQIDALPTTVRAEIAAGKVADWKGPFTPAGLDFATERHLPVALAALKEEQARFYGLVEKMSAATGRNRQLQNMITNVGRPAASERLTKIDAALEVFAQPRQPSFTDAAIGLAAPFAGPLGVAAAAGARTIGGLRKLAAAATERTGKAVSTFLGGAAKVAPVVPPLATKVLTSLRYGDERPAERQTLEAVYKARTDEIKQQVHIAADGSYQMRPSARAKMAAKLDGIRAQDPRAADRLETAGARRIEYLASIIPRLPDFGTLAVGPERRRVPELAMRSWARSAYAAEHPLEALEAMASGSFVPEYAQALHAVHPEIVADYIRQVSEQLPTLREKLPYKRRLALSILTGVPVDPAMTPGVLRVIQGMYAAEPGTQGGTQAPTAAPQFGSVAAAPATPAEQREQTVQ